MPELTVDDESLAAYLAESLAPESMANIEKSLRDSAELRARLEAVRGGGRPEAKLHSLGAIWRRGRLTCPTREQLGSFLLDVLEPEYQDYVRFHLDVIECPYCRANLDDLRRKSQEATESAPTERRRSIFHSSRHLLPSDLD